MDRSWNTPTKFFVGGILIVLVVLFLYYIRNLLPPLVISALLAIVLQPGVTFLENKTPLRHKGAATIVFILFLAVLVVIPAVVTPIVLGEVDSMEKEVQTILAGLNDFFSRATILGYHLFKGIPAEMESSVGNILHPGQLFASVQAITENVIWSGVVLFIVYYLLVDWHSARNWAYSWLPDTIQYDGKRLYQRLVKVWDLYLRGQLVTMMIVGILSGIAAALLGLPGAIIIGFVATAFAVVPSVGSSSMAVVAGIVALFVNEDGLFVPKFWYVAIVVGVFALIHLFDNYYLRPRVLGQGLKLHPVVVLIGVLGALMLSGGLLALVIVPLISSGEIILRYVLCRLTGDDPWEDEILEPTSSGG